MAAFSLADAGFVALLSIADLPWSTFNGCSK
jgi:hypothetical protein